MWEEYGRCSECKTILDIKHFSSPFFIPVCPKCGEKNNPEYVTARIVYKSKWYNPLTWFSFGWEIKEDTRS